MIPGGSWAVSCQISYPLAWSRPTRSPRGGLAVAPGMEAGVGGGGEATAGGGVEAAGFTVPCCSMVADLHPATSRAASAAPNNACLNMIFPLADSHESACAAYLFYAETSNPLRRSVRVDRCKYLATPHRTQFDPNTVPGFSSVTRKSVRGVGEAGGALARGPRATVSFAVAPGVVHSRGSREDGQATVVRCSPQWNRPPSARTSRPGRAGPPFPERTRGWRRTPLREDSAPAWPDTGRCRRPGPRGPGTVSIPAGVAGRISKEGVRPCAGGRAD